MTDDDMAILWWELCKAELLTGAWRGQRLAEIPEFRQIVFKRAVTDALRQIEAKSK